MQRRRRAPTCASAATGPTSRPARPSSGTDPAAGQRLPPRAARRRRPLVELGVDPRNGVNEDHVDIELPARCASPPSASTRRRAPPRARARWGRCVLALGARVRRPASDRGREGGPTAPGRAVDRAAASTPALAHHLTELRPDAPLDDVRFVRVQMVHPVDQPQARARPLRAPGLRERPAPAAGRLRLRAEAARRRPAATFDARATGRRRRPSAATSGTSTATAATNRHRHVRDATRRTASPALPGRPARDRRRRRARRVPHARPRRPRRRDLRPRHPAPDDRGRARASDQPARARRRHDGPPGRADQQAGRYQGGAVQPLDLRPGTRSARWDVTTPARPSAACTPSRQFGRSTRVQWNGTTPTPLGTLGGRARRRSG